jgi:hypothetical protein
MIELFWFLFFLKRLLCEQAEDLRDQAAELVENIQ